jgi:hypothetical protein
MMIDNLEIWSAALRGWHGMIFGFMIPGFDFVELLRDCIQRDAEIDQVAYIPSARQLYPLPWKGRSRKQGNG